jgi:hypothetical protein
VLRHWQLQAPPSNILVSASWWTCCHQAPAWPERRRQMIGCALNNVYISRRVSKNTASPWGQRLVLLNSGCPDTVLLPPPPAGATLPITGWGLQPTQPAANGTNPVLEGIPVSHKLCDIEYQFRTGSDNSPYHLDARCTTPFITADSSNKVSPASGSSCSAHASSRGPLVPAAPESNRNR